MMGFVFTASVAFAGLSADGDYPFHSAENTNVSIRSGF